MPQEDVLRVAIPIRIPQLADKRSSWTPEKLDLIVVIINVSELVSNPLLSVSISGRHWVAVEWE